MIKYNLKCENKHEFESWFSDSKEFENLKKKKLLECIFCASKKINKSIMSPMVSVTKKLPKNFTLEKNKEFEAQKKELLNIRNFIEKNFEYVGKNFSKKVREIYYDKKNDRTIYGTTTEKERKELSDEGIDLLTIPWINKDN
tara:strand:- start:398 stop:823 length:426 start_codon:yes stop_codon:yes gene_type:complete